MKIWRIYCICLVVLAFGTGCESDGLSAPPFDASSVDMGGDSHVGTSDGDMPDAELVTDADPENMVCGDGILDPDEECDDASDDCVACEVLPLTITESGRMLAHSRAVVSTAMK